MYNPSKRVLSACLIAGLIFSAANVDNVVKADQSYDSSNVGIANKVGEYIEETESEDPVSDLTNGVVSVKDVNEEAESTEAVEAEAEDASVTDVTDASTTDASATDASATDASATDASATDAAIAKAAELTKAERFTQFQDRAVCTCETKLNIRTEPNSEAEVIGVIERGGICLVDEVYDEWTKIESGTCVGYVANMYLAYGDSAGDWCNNNGVTRRATVTTTTLKVRETKDEESECVTLIPEGEDYYVYSVSDEWTEVLIDDGLRGFVKNDYVDLVFDTTRAVSVEEQAEMDRKAQEEADRAWLEYLAQQEAAAQAAAAETQQAQPQQTVDNSQQTQVVETAPAQTAEAETPAAEAPAAETPVAETPAEPAQETYEETYVEPATEAPTTEAPVYYAAPAGQSGVDLANYACQFVGNPYVWGGTSLTNGADCSGFVMTLYAMWGYSLPHNAAAQSNYGTEVSLSDLQPGDLLFYSNGGGIGHVAIYIGGGMIVHAASSRDGIKTSAYNYSTPVKAVRILGQ